MLKLTKNNLITFKTPFKNMLPGKLFIGLNTTRGKENLINQLSIVILVTQAFLSWYLIRGKSLPNLEFFVYVFPSFFFNFLNKLNTFGKKND